MANSIVKFLKEMNTEGMVAIFYCTNQQDSEIYGHSSTYQGIMFEDGHVEKGYDLFSQYSKDENDYAQYSIDTFENYDKFTEEYNAYDITFI